MIQFEADSNFLYHIFRRACDLNDKRLLFLLIETFKTNHTLENILLRAIGHDDIKVMNFILSGAKDNIDIDYEINGFNPLLLSKIFTTEVALITLKSQLSFITPFPPPFILSVCPSTKISKYT